MEKLNLKIYKKTFILLCSLICIFLIGCEDRLINKYHVNYEIQSIRVDDDAEFHILAISKSGYIKAIKDAKVPYDINIKYVYCEKPILRLYYSDRCCGKGNYQIDDNPSIFLPFGYKIETFND